MIEWIRGWLITVVGAALLVSGAESLLPAGTLRRTVSLIGGLILMLTMLRPLLGVDLSGLELDTEPYAREIEQQLKTLEEEQDEKLAKRIREQTEAYILEQASSLGLACKVEVTLREKDGVPHPYEVNLECTYSRALAEVIAQDLDIPEERQVWNDVG